MHWHKPFTQTLVNEQWFTDGDINMCYNAVDRHVHQGHGNRVAFYEDSVYTLKQRAWTYEELLD